MWLDSEWQRRGLEALRDTLDVDSRTRRDMIQFLFDEGFWDAEKLSWDAAVARWNDCLNPGKSAFFKIGELWALMKRFERFHLWLAMGDDLGFEHRRRPTEERLLVQLEKLTTAIEHSERQLADARAEIARLSVAGQRVPSLRNPVEAMQPSQPMRFSYVDDDGAAPGGF
jgi:hypothetical protein